MKLEILAMDGLWAAAEAWRLSREVDVPVDWEQVYTVDCPVNEMPSVLLHFKDFTILEREIIATSRIHVMWARTSFVDKPDKYELPPDLIQYADDAVHQAIKARMADGKARGLHQDEWRQDLPVMAMTCFVCRVSYRDLIKLCKYFLYLSRHQEVTMILRNRFIHVVEEMAHVIDKFTGSKLRTEQALNGMTQVKFLYEDIVKEYPLVEEDHYYLIGISMPVWLRAHFVRHRPLSFVDNFFDILREDGVMDLTIRIPVIMDIGTTKAFWNTLLGKRNCWLTQSTLSRDQDPWARIAEEFSVVGTAVLPCADGHCPHHRDAQLRVELRDPGCPCPRYMNFMKIDQTPFKERIEQALVSRPDFWRTEVR